MKSTISTFFWQASAFVKIRHAYVRHGVQPKSVNENVHYSPKINHHEQAYDAADHHILSFFHFIGVASGSYTQGAHRLWFFMRDHWDTEKWKHGNVTLLFCASVLQRFSGKVLSVWGFASLIFYAFAISQIVTTRSIPIPVCLLPSSLQADISVCQYI